MIDEKQIQDEISDEVAEIVENELADYKGSFSREFKVGHRWLVLVHGWTDPADPAVGEGRVFGLRITVGKYLNAAIVLGNVGV